MSAKRQSLVDFFEGLKRDVGLELRVCMPAHVIEYIAPQAGPRPTPPRVRVRIELKYARECRKGDQTPNETFIPNANVKLPGEAVGEYADGSLLVPVHFPGPWGMWSCGPLLVGEQGKLVWCDRSIDSWQIDGGDVPVDPVFGHTHGGGIDGGPMNDAWFEPGVRSGKGLAGMVTSTIPTNAWRIGTADGAAGMTINSLQNALPLDMLVKTTGPTMTLDAATAIKVGANATSFGAKADLVSAKLIAFKAAISAAAVVAGDGGAAFKANIMTALNALDLTTPAIAATKAKLE